MSKPRLRGRPAGIRSPRKEVAAAIAKKISAGTYPIGCHLPPLRTLAKVHNVSVTTASRALSILSQEGFIQGVVLIVRPTGRWVPPPVPMSLIWVPTITAQRRTLQWIAAPWSSAPMWPSTPRRRSTCASPRRPAQRPRACKTSRLPSPPARHPRLAC